jgi:hypothetical protein
VEIRHRFFFSDAQGSGTPDRARSDGKFNTVSLEPGAFSENGNPTLDTLLRVMKALGVRLAIAA